MAQNRDIQAASQMLNIHDAGQTKEGSMADWLERLQSRSTELLKSSPDC